MIHVASLLTPPALTMYSGSLQWVSRSVVLFGGQTHTQTHKQTQARTHTQVRSALLYLVSSYLRQHIVSHTLLTRSLCDDAFKGLCHS